MRPDHALQLLDALTADAAPAPVAYLRALAARTAAAEGSLRVALEGRLAQAFARLEPTLHGTARASRPAGEGLAMLLADLQAASSSAAHYPRLPSLEPMRQQWTTLRGEQQVRRALQDVPDDGGPLNSSVLVNRALTLMHDVSPAYLRHYIAYVDALNWLQQLPPPGSAPAPEPKARRPRARKGS